MTQHSDITEMQLRALIHAGNLSFAGHKNLKIYGLLSCSSGKRMKRENRVFFTSDVDALQADYRPCGHCLNQKYRDWKLQRPT